MPLKLKPKPLNLKKGQNGEHQKMDRTMDPMPVSLTILSGADLYNYVPDEEGNCGYRRFVFDIDSLQFNDRLILDWNHNPDEVIGALEKLNIQEGKLNAEGFIVPFRDDDRAAEVAYKARFVPFGVSPLVAFDEAEAVCVNEGESIEANGRTYDGEIVLFRNARILGAAICPYPTDELTAVTALGNTNGALTKEEELIMSIFKFSTDEEKKKKNGNIVNEPDPHENDSETDNEEEEQNEGGDDTENEGQGAGGGGDDDDQTDTQGGGDDTEPGGGAVENSKSVFDALKQLSEQIKTLSDAVIEEKKCREESLSKLTAAAKTIQGAEPVGFSVPERCDMSYAEAVNRQLDKINHR